MSLLFPATSIAQHVSVEQAREKATEFFKGKASNGTNSSARKAMKQRSEAKLTLANQDATYYVFNVGESQGFVIVSGDERTTPVLGYADKGRFEEGNLPEGLKQLLGQYQSEMKMLNEMGVQNAVPRNLSETKRPAIEPLLRTAWGQDDPYNRMCPEQSVTGCVATATAQIMDYHHWPTATTATIPGYTTSTSQYEIPDLEPTTFDWEQIARHEKGMEEQITAESCDAVAKLMYYVGASLEMDYTTWESGSSQFMAVPALQQYFDYDAYLLERDAKSSLFWDDILYNELSQGRPILYVGNNNSLLSAHAFVCDGYDGEGRFHFDWGWDGDENGYFVPTAFSVNTGLGSWPVEGFSAWQCIIGGIRPKGTVLAEDDRMQELLDAVENYTPQSAEFLSLEKVEVENGTDYDLLHVTLHNSGTEDFDDQFFVYGSHILGASSVDCRYVRIPAGESMTADFYAYGENTTFSISTNEGFGANADAQLWKDEKNSYFLFANGEDIVIPEDVTAAYLQCNLMRVTPNSNPNTLYYIPYKQDLPQAFEGKNMVVGTNSENVTLDNHHAFVLPFDFTASHVKMKASVSTSGANALTIPFDAALPEGATAMQYNYNDEGHAYFVPVGEMCANGLFLVSSDKEYIEFESTNTEIQGISRPDAGMFPLTHQRTYGDTMQNVYVYDAAEHAFVKASSVDTLPFSFVFAPNENRNLADVIEVAESAKNPFTDLDYEFDMLNLFCDGQVITEGTYTINPDDPYQFAVQFSGGFKDELFYPITVIGLSQEGQLVKNLHTSFSGGFMTVIDVNSVPDGTYKLTAFYQAFTGGLYYPADAGEPYDFKKEGNTITVKVKKHLAYDVETRVEGGLGGTISPVINGKVKENTVLHLEAKPDEGWSFLKWVIQGGEFQEIYEPTLDYVVNLSVTIGAVFKPNQYHVTFTVDGDSVYSEMQDYGTEIVAPENPEKEGHTFMGWSPVVEATVPLHDVTYVALFTINQYTLTYIVDGETYKVQTLDYGTAIEPLENLNKGGYTFSGWSDIPQTMPAHDVMVTGSFEKFAGFDYCTILMEELINTIDLFDSSNRDSISSMIEFYDNARYTLMEWNDEQVIEITRPVDDIIHAEMNNLYASRFDADETQLLADYPEKEEPIRKFFELQRKNYGDWVDAFCPSLYAGFPSHSGKVFDYHEKQELQDLLDKYYESAKQMFMAEDGVMASVLPSTAFQDVAWNASTIIFNSYQTMENWDDPDPMPFVGEPEKDANGNAWYDVDYDESTASNNSVAGELLSWYPHEFYCTSNEDSYVSNVGTGEIADVYYRRSFSIERPLYGDVYLFCSNADQHELYINGEHVFSYAEPEYIDVLEHPYISSMARGLQHRKLVKLPDSVKEKLKTDGSVNVIAAKLHTTRFGAFVDCGLYLQRGEIGMGDVNEDGVVDIADAAGVVNLIIENKTEHLNRKVADMNGDGEVSVADATLITDKITRVEDSQDNSSTMMAETKADTQTTLSASEVRIGQDKNAELVIDMTNVESDCMCAFSLDIHLPDGISLVRNSAQMVAGTDHGISCNYADGYYSLACLSMTNSPLVTDEGLMKLTLHADADLDFDIYDVLIDNIVLGDRNNRSYHGSNVNGKIQVINQYRVTFLADGETMYSELQDYGTEIIAPEDPLKEGHTFVGWDHEVDATVPAHDVTYEAQYEVNHYWVRYYVLDQLVHEEEVAYGDSYEIYEYVPEKDYIFNDWMGEKYDTMPAHDIAYHADIVSGMNVTTLSQKAEYYDLSGRKQTTPRQNGITIKRRTDGRYIKVNAARKR